MEFIMTKCAEQVKLFNAATVRSVNVEEDGTAIIPAYDDELGDVEYICVDRNGNPCALGDAIITTDELRKPQTKAATAEYSGGYDLRTAEAVLRWLARWYDDDRHIKRAFGYIVDLDDFVGAAAKTYAEKILADIERGWCTSGD